MTDPTPREKKRIEARKLIEAKIAEIDQGYKDGTWRNPWPGYHSIVPSEIRTYWMAEREELEKELVQLGGTPIRAPWETTSNMNEFRQDVRDFESLADKLLRETANNGASDRARNLAKNASTVLDRVLSFLGKGNERTTWPKP